MGVLIGLVVADVAYCLCWVIPMIKETRDCLKLMRIAGAWDGFKGYWGIWNIVDWVCIIISLVVTIFWVVTCNAMKVDGIQSLLVESDGEWTLIPGSMELDS